MNTFYDLPTDLQEYIHGFNPYHRTKLEKVHEELVMSQTYICDYEYCEAEVNRVDAVQGFIYLPSQLNWTRQFHFCNEDCKSAGMGWIYRDYRKALRRLGF